MSLEAAARPAAPAPITITDCRDAFGIGEATDELVVVKNAAMCIVIREVIMSHTVSRMRRIVDVTFTNSASHCASKIVKIGIVIRSIRECHATIIINWTTCQINSKSWRHANCPNL